MLALTLSYDAVASDSVTVCVADGGGAGAALGPGEGDRLVGRHGGSDGAANQRPGDAGETRSGHKQNTHDRTRT